VSHSTQSRPNKKPKKPFDGFPLTAHRNGQWCKKSRGKQYYFGLIDDWQSALDRYNHEWPHIIEGRTPPPLSSGEEYVTLKDVCNAFLTSKRDKIDTGELSPRSFDDYYQTCECLIGHFDKDRRVDDLRPEDFARLRKAMAKQCGPVRLRNIITRVKMVLKYAYDERLIENAIHYGQSFSPPSAKTLRKSRNETGQNIFESDEVRKALDNANTTIKAMILLGVNCGFGNTDVANLPQSAVDLDAGWIEYPRPKTEINRRVPLWPETVTALQAAIAVRPSPKGGTDPDLCFRSPQGYAFVRVQVSKKDAARYNKIDLVGRHFGILLKKLQLNGRRRLGFYTLRHCFETIAGESRDQVAVNSIMGHVDHSMAGAYRERISDQRLIAVTDTVHDWLFPAEERGVE
jgi:integrase